MNAQDSERDRTGYVAEFLRVAWGGLNHVFTVPPSRVESFGVDGGDTVHATVVVSYRGRRFGYRRQIWPSGHPPLLQAQLYTTFLEERLNTRPAPAPDASEPIEL